MQPGSGKHPCCDGQGKKSHEVSTWTRAAPCPSCISMGSRRNWCSVQPVQKVPVVSTENWVVTVPVWHQTRGQTNNRVNLKCHCGRPSPPSPQHPRHAAAATVCKTILWVWYQRLQSKPCNGESYSVKGHIQRWQKVEQGTLKAQHCHCQSTLQSAGGRSRSPSPKARKGKRGGGQRVPTAEANTSKNWWANFI